MCVPAGLDAERIVVTTDAGIFVVDPASDGVTVERENTTSGTPEARLVLQGAPAEQLAGRDGITWLVEHAQAAMCVMAAGACAAALELTANYTKSREQFGRPIASFQAVSQRAADAYIDTEAVRLTAWQAAWRLDTGVPAVGTGRDRQVLGERGCAARRARGAPPPRRDGRRPRLPALPVLPAREAARAVTRFGDTVVAAARRAARRHAGFVAGYRQRGPG